MWYSVVRGFVAHKLLVSISGFFNFNSSFMFTIIHKSGRVMKNGGHEGGRELGGGGKSPICLPMCTLLLSMFATCKSKGH